MNEHSNAPVAVARYLPPADPWATLGAVDPMLALMLADAYERQARKAARHAHYEDIRAEHRRVALSGGGERERARRVRQMRGSWGQA